MRERIEQRLNDLKSELEAGHKLLAELDAKRADVQATMLRIGGAAQVLEELLAAESEPALAAVPLHTAK